MSNRNLKWPHLKALNELYLTGQTRLIILSNAYIRTLKEDKRIIRFKFGNHNIIEALPAYKKYYEENLKSAFEKYNLFFKQNDISDDGRSKYDEYDLNTLFFIVHHKAEFKNKLTTIRQFSAAVFKEKGSKYLENRPGLKNVVCKLLEVADFPDKDPKNNQWRLVVDCINPSVVILCENIAHLKQGDVAIKNNIELWFVGGNNTGIINNIADEKLANPLYYSCDWDCEGLKIYTRVKEILARKGFDINILLPYDINSSLPVNSPHHYSEWEYSKPFSGLNIAHFKNDEIELITLLMKKKHWIEEESIDLVQNLVFNEERLRC